MGRAPHRSMDGGGWQRTAAKRAQLVVLPLALGHGRKIVPDELNLWVLGEVREDSVQLDSVSIRLAGVLPAVRYSAKATTVVAATDAIERDALDDHPVGLGGEQLLQAW